jgi:hypothetical protein
MFTKTIRKRFGELCLLVPVSIVLSGIAVLVYQAWYWAAQGSWKPVASELMLDRILPHGFLKWLEEPHSWLIIKEILSPFFSVPLSLFLLTFGLVALLFAMRLYDTPAKEEKAGPQEQTTPDLRSGRPSPQLLKILASQNMHYLRITAEEANSPDTLNRT